MSKKQPQQEKKTKKNKYQKKISREQEVRRTKIILVCSAALLLSILFFAWVLPRSINIFHGKGKLVGVNKDVLAYQDEVLSECKKQGLAEYSTLLLALMQQESSGQGTDVFQCSESPFNTLYPNTPGSIADVNYSIQIGVETFAYCLDVANCEGIQDTDNLKLALQEYNFGNNYAIWAKENYGGYSLDSTYAFSYMMQQQLGWSSYGDPEYVEHVLRYFNF